MDDTEKLFLNATAAFTAFDFDCLYLAEILSSLGEVAGLYTACAGGLEKLASTFNGYAKVLEEQERFGHTQNFLTALGNTSLDLQRSTSTLARELSALCKPLEKFLHDEVGPAKNTKRALSEARTRLEESAACRAAPTPPTPTRPLPAPRVAPTKTPSAVAIAVQRQRPDFAAARSAVVEEVVESSRVLMKVSAGGRAHIAAIAEKAQSVFCEFFEKGTIAWQKIDADKIRTQDVKHASILAPSKVRKEDNCVSMGIMQMFLDLVGVEEAHITKLKSLQALRSLAAQSPKAAGFEGSEEEYELFFGPLDKAINLHQNIVLSIPERDSARSVAELYVVQFVSFDAMYVEMMKTCCQAMRMGESPKRRSFLKAHCKEDFAALRQCPIDYLRSLDKQLQVAMKIIGRSDTAYSVFHDAMKSLKTLFGRVEQARVSSENCQSLTDLTSSISGFDELVADNRRLVGQIDVTCSKGPSKYRLLLFNDLLALTSHTGKGLQVLVAKGRITSVSVQDCPSSPCGHRRHATDTSGSAAGKYEVAITWTKNNYTEQTKVGFSSAEEKQQWLFKISMAMQTAFAVQVYGVDLATLMKRDLEQGVPPFLSDALTYVLKHGLNTEGIFRVSIPLHRLDQLQTEIDSGKRPQYENPLEPASVIRAWLRSLPEPLLGGQDSSAAWEGLRDRLDVGSVRGAVTKLPEPQYRVAYALFKSLMQIAAHSETNLMTSMNLSVVFTPSVLPMAGADVMPSDALFAVVEFLIDNAREVFVSK
eukprot:m51a1_g4908 putative rho gtpase-activating protein 1 (761) ;mRNA; r:176929-180126